MEPTDWTDWTALKGLTQSVSPLSGRQPPAPASSGRLTATDRQWSAVSLVRELPFGLSREQWQHAVTASWLGMTTTAAARLGHVAAWKGIRGALHPGVSATSLSQSPAGRASSGPSKEPLRLHFAIVLHPREVSRHRHGVPVQEISVQASNTVQLDAEVVAADAQIYGGDDHIPVSSADGRVF